MKLEWHYLRIDLKPWQVSLCSNVSVWNTWRVRNCGFFVVGFLFSLKSKGENTNLSWITPTVIWISKQGGQHEHTMNNPWACSLILCTIPILIPAVIFSFVHRYCSNTKKKKKCITVIKKPALKKDKTQRINWDYSSSFCIDCKSLVIWIVLQPWAQDSLQPPRLFFNICYYLAILFGRDPSISSSNALARFLLPIA